MMLRRFHLNFLLVWILLLTAVPVCASSITLHSLVVRGGIEDSRSDDSFWEYEASFLFDLPWQWRTEGGIEIEFQLEATLGVLKGGSDSAMRISIGPRFAFMHPASDFFLYFGTSPAYISRETFENEDFGGKFTFISYIGAGFYLSPQWLIGYRFQHMSNAGIYSRNPGLNTHLFEISYLF